MGCNTPNCGQSPAAGAGVATAVPQDLSQCAGFAFCDPKLLSLPKATAMNLVGVPDGDQCLKRISAKKGVWLHNPENPGGPDYVGGLDQIVVTGMDKLATTGCSLIPALRPTTDAQGMSALELVIASPQDKDKGTLGALNTCGTNGGLRQDRIIPTALSSCPNNLFFLGFEKVTEVVDGQSVVNYQWREATEIKFPQSQVGELSSPDLTDTTNYSMAVWHKSGGCWVLKASNGNAFDGLCDVEFKTLGDTDPLNVLACTTDGLRRVQASASLLKRILGGVDSYVQLDTPISLVATTAETTTTFVKHKSDYSDVPDEARFVRLRIRCLSDEGGYCFVDINGRYATANLGDVPVAGMQGYCYADSTIGSSDQDTVMVDIPTGDITISHHAGPVGGLGSIGTVGSWVWIEGYIL